MVRRFSPTLLGIAAAVLMGAPGDSWRVLHAAQETRAPSRGDLIALSNGADLVQAAGRGDRHRYQLTLSQGEFVRLAVTQVGVDVDVETCDPDDRPIATFGDAVGPRGSEAVELVAETAGTYAITIVAAPATMVPGSYTIHLGVRRPATDLDRAAQQARGLRTDAERLQAQGHFDEAVPLLERALDITEHSRGAESADAIGLTRLLASNALERHDTTRADALYRRALTLLDRTVGAGDATDAMVRSRLALLAERAGQRPTANALLEPAMTVLERTLGTDHPWYVQSLITLGTLRADAGDLDQAEEIDLRAMATLEKLQMTDDIPYADAMNNLGEVYWQRMSYDRAEDLFRRSLAIGERLRGADSYYVATTLQNLGIIARERKAYATAIAYYTRVLAIRERVVGPDHMDVAQVLNNLANVYRATGDLDKALETHFRALRIWESTAGPYDRGTMVSVGNIARTYASMGNLSEAIAYQHRAEALLEGQLTLNLAIGSERQKLAYVRSIADRLDRTLSMHLDLAPGRADAGELAMLVLLQRKGRVLDAMADTVAAVRQHANIADRALLDRLSAITSNLARVALTPATTASADRRTQIHALEVEKEHLEEQLSARSAEFRAQTRPVTVDAVQAAMPEDAALVEFAIYRPFNPKAERNDDAYGAPRYAAYLLRKYLPPCGHDLGPVKTIDAAVDAFRQALRDPGRADLQAKARAVDALVMQPMRGEIGAAARLLLSPDGALNLVPFEALVDDQGRYLIERYSMSYVTSGRDLLRMQETRASRSAPMIVANPLFGEPGRAAAATSRQAISTDTTKNAWATTYFAPLGATAEEGRAIKALLPDARLITGRLATKSAVTRVDAPRILHIASHGFFLQATPDLLAAENPLLRSGLALAGANAARGPHDAGILTALEASSLNLWGTKLVTLSACDTGVGEVLNGEGVYGLRRAFVLAGAETLVMSLWPVSDAVARETMIAYYAGLRVGLGRGDALRQAKLSVLRQKGHQHPFYWASFIQSGEWSQLDMTRE